MNLNTLGPEFNFMMTLNKTELNCYIDEAIKLQQKNRGEIIKYGKMLGCDINDVMFSTIDYNDIISFGICLKYGADINSIVDDTPLLHYCVFNKNYAVLRTIILKGAKLDIKDTNNITALELALYNLEYECAKELILGGANVNFTTKINDENFSALTLFFHNYDKKDNKKRLEILELIVSKLIKLEINIIKLIIDLMKDKYIDEIDIILTKFPETVNRKHMNITILSFIIELKIKKLIDKFIRLETTNLNIKNKRPYLHNLSANCDINNVKYILDKYPKIINNLCDANRTALEHVLINFDDFNEDEKENAFVLIKYLIDKKCNINNINEYGIETIFTAIQYTNYKIVELLIDSGSNIKKVFINKHLYKYPLKNRDYVSFAAQIGKNDIIDLLLKKGAPLNFYNGIPICLLISIFFNKAETVKFLLNYTESKKYMNQEFMKKILDYSVNNGISNREILKYFTTDDVINELQKNSLNIKIINFEKKIEKHYKKYKENKKSILMSFYFVLDFLKSCYLLNNKKDIPNIIKSFLIVHSSDEYDDARNIFLPLFFSVNNFNSIDSCFNIVEMIFLRDEIKDYDFEFLFKIKKNIETIYDDIILTFKIIKQILYNDKDYTDEKITIWFTNTDNYIEKVLVKLKYPKKMDHYDKMCDKIKGKHCIITENDNCITINDPDDKMIVEIFKINHLKVPDLWFDFYSFNIGFDHKSDPNHMFPFVLDKKLSNVPCYEIKSNDEINNFGFACYKYFYGIYTIGKKKQFGFFEYFIDATGTLFHRMFRPYSQLSDKLKEKIMKQFPDEYKVKYNLII
jgi:ankyrin repeat protein